MPFVKGKSGNPKGADRKSKAFLACLERVIKQDEGKKLRAAVEKLYVAAASGEPWALNMLADRLDGKPAQAVTGDEGGAIRLEVTWQNE